MNIEDYRKQINEIDKKLATLLDERLDVCKKIGEYKKENNIPVLDSRREEEVFANIKTNAKHEEVVEIYKEIINQSKKVQ